MVDATVDADEIVPGLFVGSLAAALNIKWLEDNKIRAIINVCQSKYVPPAFTTYLHMPMEDSGDAPLASALLLAWPLFVEFMDAGPGQGVLVHCKLGRSRSVALATMLLMRHRRLSLKDAFVQVAGARARVLKETRRVPLLGFQLQLTAFEREEFDTVANSTEDWAGAVTHDALSREVRRSARRARPDVDVDVNAADVTDKKRARA